MVQEDGSTQTRPREFLYRIQATRPGMVSDGPNPQEAEILTRHFDYLASLAEKGIVFLSGRTQNTDSTSFGIVIFRASGAEEARQIMQDDPAVRHGVMRAEVYPYRIAILGSGDGFGPSEGGE